MILNEITAAIAAMPVDSFAVVYMCNVTRVDHDLYVVAGECLASFDNAADAAAFVIDAN
jgi:hypothetical protein